VAEHPAGGKVASSIPPGLELRQTRPIAEGTILVQGTIPEGVGDITSGSTDVADKLAQHWASHNSSIAGLQVVRAVELFRLTIVEAQATVLHLLSIHDDGQTS